MSRRALSLLVALGLLLSLTGCGKGASEPMTAGNAAFGPEDSALSAQETGEEDTALRTSASFAMPCNESYGWDPFSCVGMENRAVMELIYESLFVLNNQFEAEPLLCRSVTVSEDGMTYTLALREATFSNGKTLAAEDVVYSMNQAAMSQLYADRFRDISVYYASDASTVILEMVRPNDRVLCLLDFPIIPAFGGTDAPAGTGPFVRTGDSLAVNNLWWQGPERLRFQTVTLFSSASAEDTRDSFEIDGVHFVYNNPNAATAAEFHCDYELWNSRGTVMQYIGFNMAGYGIFTDYNARAAVSHAIDRVSIAESVYHNFADAASLPAPPSSSLYDEALAQRFAFTSVQDARAELLETDYFYAPPTAAQASPAPSGEPSETRPEDEDDESEDEEAPDEEEPGDPDEEAPGDTEDVTYNNVTMLVMDGNLRRVAAARQVAQNLEDVGFTVTLRELEHDEFIYTLNAGGFDLYYGEVTLQPDLDLRPLLTAGGSVNFGGASSTTLSSLLEKARENSGNYYDLYEFILEYGYLCPVFFINNAVFTTRGVFTGLDPTPDALFYQIADIQVDHD